jgi:hypothetical protein
MQVTSNHNIKASDMLAFLDLARSEQVEDQYKASLWLARSAASYMRDNRWKPRLPDMLKNLDEFILLAYRDECFTVTGVESGDVVRDPYAKFFSQGK